MTNMPCMNIDGHWNLVIDSPMGRQQANVELRTEAGQLLGTLVNTTNGLSSDIFDGTVEGDALGWKIRMNKIRLTLSFNTTVTGDQMAGKVKAGSFGSFKVTGER